MGKNNLFSSEIEMIGISTQIPFDGEDYLYRQLENFAEHIIAGINFSFMKNHSDV